MDEIEFTFTAKLWLYQGKGAWHFITLPKENADQIKFFTSHQKKRGWGSVRVHASINDVDWKTSIFPSKSDGSYLLPVKADVHKKAKIIVDDDVTVNLKIKTGL